MRLTEHDSPLVAIALGAAQNDEKAVAVALELRTLMRPVGILDGQVVQAELLLDLPEQLFVRLMEPDPDELIGLTEGRGDLVNCDVGDTPATRIRRGVDDGTHPATKFLASAVIPWSRITGLRRRCVSACYLQLRAAVYSRNGRTTQYTWSSSSETIRHRPECWRTFRRWRSSPANRRLSCMRKSQVLSNTA